jgi:hypothetical protein
MKRQLVLLVGLCLLAAAWLVWTLPAQAQPAATYQLLQSNIGPAQAGTGGAYTLSSSAGQPDAGEVSAGSYTLGGGFWGGGIINTVVDQLELYLPLVLR